MADWKIAGPSSGKSGGTLLNKGEHEGHLLGFIGVELLEGVQTQHGTTDAALCHWTFCVDDGLVLVDVPHFGTALVPRLIEGAKEAPIVAGRLGRANAKPGRNAAWILWDPSDEDRALVEKWLDAHAVTMPSGTIQIEPPPQPETPEEAEEPF